MQLSYYPARSADARRTSPAASRAFCGTRCSLGRRVPAAGRRARPDRQPAQDPLSRSRAAGAGGLRRAQPLSLKEVAEHLGISLPAASRVVDPLVQRRLVERHEDAEDRRVKRVRLTARRRVRSGGSSATRVASLEELLATFTVTERRKLADALDEISTRPEISRYCPRKAAPMSSAFARSRIRTASGGRSARCASRSS